MINANRVIREGQKKYMRPIDTRESLIKEIRDRYQHNMTFSNFFSDLCSIEIESICDPSESQQILSPTKVKDEDEDD